MREVAVLGRVCADLYPVELRTPLRRVSRFERYVGGFAGNLSTGLARLGVPVAIVSGVGDDGHGEFVRDFLAAEGVDCTLLGTHPTLRTALAFCEAWPPDCFPITFYRTPTCPDWELRLGPADIERLAGAPLLYATGTALAVEPSAATTLHALSAHAAGDGLTIFDLDWRSQLWDDELRFASLCQAAIASAEIVLGGDSEIEAAMQGGGVEAILAAGPRAVVAKHGPAGATVHTADGSEHVAGLRVDVVNGLGAGDAFAAAFGASLLDDPDDLPGAVRLANVAGAIVAGRHSCSTAMPTRHELDSVAREHP